MGDVPWSPRLAAGLVLASLVVALANPCPPRDVPAPAEAHADHSAHAEHATHDAHAPGQSESAECHRATSPTSFSAVCPCGCGERPHAAAGVFLELAHGASSRAPALFAPPTVAALARDALALPEPASRVPEPVPLAG